VALGEGGEGTDVGRGVEQHLLDGRELVSGLAGDRVQLLVHGLGVGWAKIVRIAAASISWEPSGTLASTLRMKWTRHRCQAAPIITAAIAL
jgi:hypothetical protein